MITEKVIGEIRKRWCLHPGVKKKGSASHDFLQVFEYLDQMIVQNYHSEREGYQKALKEIRQDFLVYQKNTEDTVIQIDGEKQDLKKDIEEANRRAQESMSKFINCTMIAVPSLIANIAFIVFIVLTRS